jgi:hypothetical protein
LLTWVRSRLCTFSIFLGEGLLCAVASPFGEPSRLGRRRPMAFRMQIWHGFERHPQLLD